MRAVWVWSITILNTILFWLALYGIKLLYGWTAWVATAAVLLVVSLVWLFWLKVWKE